MREYPAPRYLIALLFVLSLCSGLDTSAQPAIDHQQAHHYFDEAAVLCAKDNGKLWGQSLCVPMMFVDPQSRYVVANQADAEGLLSADGPVYSGTLPKNFGAANSASTIGGTQFTMLMWPPPEDQTMRAELMMHECWHNIQDDLGFPSRVPANAHLETVDGRLWLRMEWHALRTALETSGDTRRKAITDALTFRAYRRMLIDSAAEQERIFELHEGLAEYTGVRLCGMTPAEARKWQAQRLEKSEAQKTFVSTFAYWSGPSFGLLLDAADDSWRDDLTAEDDLGDLLRTAYGIQLPTDIAKAAEETMVIYDGDEVRRAEIARMEAHRELIRKYTATFVDGPVIVLPLTKPQISYDPRTVTQLEGHGRIYGTFRMADAWGVIEGSEGCLLDGGWSTLTVGAPSDVTGNPVEGDGWTLTLNDGWRLTPATRSGDYTVTNE